MGSVYLCTKMLESYVSSLLSLGQLLAKFVRWISCVELEVVLIDVQQDQQLREIPIPTLIKAVGKLLVLTHKSIHFTVNEQQPPQMGGIPIPALIKAEIYNMEAAGPSAQKHSFSR